MALVLGVTGSIATGKSLLCRHLAERHGAVHGDADRIVHRMFDPGKPGFYNAVKQFGDRIVGEDGYIDRRKVGAIVFGNPEAMARWTTAIGDIAAEMKETIDRWHAELPQDGLAVLEAVNLIEAGYCVWCDGTWLVAAEDGMARARLMERNRFTLDEANQRLASARDWRLREPASDRVFHNNGSLHDFLAAIDGAMAQTRAQFKAGTLPRPRYFAWSAKHKKDGAVQA